MKQFAKENKILLFLVLAAILAAIFMIGVRLTVEQANKTYDVVLDYQELEEMANQSEHPLAWWFREFKTLGITKVGLAEESLNTIMQENDFPVSARMMFEVLQDAAWAEQFPAPFLEAIQAKHYDDFDVLVEAKSIEAYRFIAEALQQRYDHNKFVFYPTAEGGMILIDGTAKDALYSEKYKEMDSQGIGFLQKDRITGSKIMYLSLGFLPEKVEAVEAAGMTILPRTASYSRWNDVNYAQAVIDGYQKLAQAPEYLIVAGEAIPGNDEDLDLIRDYVMDNQITLGLIENTTQLQNILQLGVEDVVKNTDYQVVRVFTLWNYIQNRYQYYGYEGSEEIENTLFRAVVERNIRLIYFKPMREFKDNHVYITDMEEYRTLFDGLNQRLEEQGIHQGSASRMAANTVPLWIRLILGIGTVAAAVLLIRTILPIGRKTKASLFLLGAIGITGLFFLSSYWTTLLVSFAAAVVFPCLATVLVVKAGKAASDDLPRDTPITRLALRGGLILAGAVAISLIGGLMTAAPLSATNFMLEIDIFRGVKLAQLLPLAYFILVYLAYYGYGASKSRPGSLEFEDLKDLMNSSIKVWMILLGVLLLGLGYYYIARTGHDTEIMPSTAEMLFRNMLEEDLVARPRTKEFLFAFPSVVMLIYVSVRRFPVWPILFSLASVIGLTSVVNTFMHIRTPLYLGFYRTGYSLLFGFLLGVLGMLIFEGVHRMYKKIERQYRHNE